MPKVSVVIPVYNAEQFILHCVNSVLDQSFHDFEIILVDDGSHDHSLKICEEISIKDKRIRFFHKENGGSNSARRYGVEQAKGDYINFIDVDDTIPKDSIDNLYKKAIQYDLDITQSAQYFWKNQEDKPFFSGFPSDGIYNNIEFLHLLFKDRANGGPHGCLYKRGLFGKETFNLPNDVKLGEDFYMNLCLGLQAKKVGLFNDIITYNYLDNTNSVTYVYRYTSISPQQGQLESIRRELNNNQLFDEFSDDFYRRALGVLASACFHNHQLIYEQYIKQMAHEIWPNVHFWKEKCLCYMLLHPSILPIMNTINESRKIVSNIRKKIR